MKFVTVGPLIEDRLVKFVQSKDLFISHLTFDPPSSSQPNTHSTAPSISNVADEATTSSSAASSSSSSKPARDGSRDGTEKGRPKLPSFWVPTLTPDAKPTEIKKPVSHSCNWRDTSVLVVVTARQREGGQSCRASGSGLTLLPNQLWLNDWLATTAECNYLPPSLSSKGRSPKERIMFFFIIVSNRWSFTD